MDTIDRLGGYLFSSTAHNVKLKCNDDNVNLKLNVQKGYVTARMSGRVKYEMHSDENGYQYEQGRTSVSEPGKMYLGLENPTNRRTGGYVLVGLEDAIRTAISHNVTFERTLSEGKLRDLRKTRE